MSEDKFSSGLNDFLSVTDSNEDDEMMEAPLVKKKPKAEKPKSEQKPAEKVQEPKDEPKASEKPKNAPKKVKPKAFLCYLPPKVIDHIDQYKKLFHMSYGDFMAEAVAAWEAQHEKYAQAVAQWDSIREKAEADEYEISKQGK